MQTLRVLKWSAKFAKSSRACCFLGLGLLIGEPLFAQSSSVRGPSISINPNVRPEGGSSGMKPSPPAGGGNSGSGSGGGGNHGGGGHSGGSGNPGGYPGHGSGHWGSGRPGHHHGYPLIYPPIVIDEWGGYPYQGIYYGYGTISYPTYVTPYPYYGGNLYSNQLPYAPGFQPGVQPGAWVWNRQPFNAGQGIVPGNFGVVQPNGLGAPAGNAAPRGAVAPMQAAVPDALQNPDAITPEQEILRRVSVLKPSNEAGRARSDDLIADGDREFADQAFRRAVHIYRQAIAKAPDYSTAHLRAGHAYVATGDFDLALNYFCMGFELARNTARPGFSLADLYRGDDQAKQQHEAVLLDTIQRQPEDGGLLFLLGVTKYYDGRPLEAKELFQKSADMDGAQKRYAKLFLQ